MVRGKSHGYSIKQKNWECVRKNVVKKYKNKCCSKLPEIARKLIENYFWKLTNFFKLKKTKCFEIVWNCEKIDQKYFWNFDQNFYTWNFPSLLALVGVTKEKGLHWLPKATIATWLQRGVDSYQLTASNKQGMANCHQCMQYTACIDMKNILNR